MKSSSFLSALSLAAIVFSTGVHSAPADSPEYLENMLPTEEWGTPSTESLVAPCWPGLCGGGGGTRHCVYDANGRIRYCYYYPVKPEIDSEDLKEALAA